MTTRAFESELADVAGRVEAALDGLTAAEPGDRLGGAIRYAVLGSGKRLRPFVLVTAAALFDVREADAMRAACAVECVHAYSLVHDDLPAMDDDDLRRGRATVHRAFDEATAILAGDCLLTLAFDILAAPATRAAPDRRARLVAELARAAGTAGMAGGQMRDLAAEGRFADDSRPLALTAEEITALQERKTGALFRCAALGGAVLGGADAADCDRLARFGRALGLAFQIADDLLDEEASAEDLGKATAKDRARGKATLPAVLGPKAARERRDSLVAEAHGALAPFGTRAEMLLAAARFAADRRR